MKWEKNLQQWFNDFRIEVHVLKTMASSENFQYGVHLPKCSAISCACPLVENRLQEGLKTLGVSTVMGRDKYSKTGLRSDHFLKFTKQSLFTVIFVCHDVVASFKQCFEKAEGFNDRFLIVLTEVTPIPTFLGDREFTRLYNLNDTKEYESLMNFLDKNIVPSLRVTGTSTTRVVQRDSEGDTPEYDGGLSPPLPRSVHQPEGRTIRLPIENESEGNSESLDSFAIDTASRFVSLPSLHTCDHTDRGPMARYYCTEIDHDRTNECRYQMSSFCT